MTFSASYGINAGTRHLSEGISCQDFALKAFDKINNRALVVVADGAGSKRYARESAICAAECLHDLFNAGLLTVNSSREYLLEAINKSFSDTMLPHQELGTTLLFVYVCQNDYLVGHMGDGVIISDIDNQFKVLSQPENGEMPYITFFVPTKQNNSPHFRLQKGTLSKDTTFILASDGTADLLYDSSTNLAAKACDILKEWNTQLPSAECDIKINQSLKELFSEYSSDDQTIAVLSVLETTCAD